MSESFEKEIIGEMVDKAMQDLDHIEFPQDAGNLVVTKIEQQIGKVSRIVENISHSYFRGKTTIRRRIAEK